MFLINKKLFKHLRASLSMSLSNLDNVVDTRPESKGAFTSPTKKMGNPFSWSSLFYSSLTYFLFTSCSPSPTSPPVGPEDNDLGKCGAIEDVLIGIGGYTGQFYNDGENIQHGLPADSARTIMTQSRIIYDDQGNRIPNAKVGNVIATYYGLDGRIHQLEDIDPDPAVWDYAVRFHNPNRPDRSGVIHGGGRLVVQYFREDDPTNRGLHECIIVHFNNDGTYNFEGSGPFEIISIFENGDNSYFIER